MCPRRAGESGGTGRLVLFHLALLVAVNVVVCRKLFFLEFLDHMQSNEGAFIALARMLGEHPWETLWWPFWNGGMPYTHTYFPLLPATSALLAAAGGLAPAAAFHTVCAVFYCFGPVTLYLMARQLAKSAWASFGAALGYSLFSPSALLIPAIREDGGGLWHARRLHNLVFYGESPHVVALTLVPLALLLLCRALRLRPAAVLPAGVLVSAVLLTNAFGIATLAIASVCLLLAETETPWRRRLAVFGGAFVLGFLWIAPWIPPSLVESIRMNSSTAGGDFRPTAASIAGGVLLAGAFVALHLAARRLRLPRHLHFALLFALAMASIVLPAFYAEIHVVPQGKRYHLEFEMGVWLLAGFVAAAVARQWPRRARAVAAVVLLGAAAAQFGQTLRYAEALIRPHPDVTGTIEYRTAKWFDGHLRGQRVMVPGSSAFWFNAFTDNPQLSGGNDATAPNWMQRVAVFIIYSGMNAGAHDGEIAVLWLKAFGAHAVAVPGPASEEAYKPFSNSRKFDGLLPVLWREGHDTIYAVPQRSTSLAHVIPASAVVGRAPAHGVDIAPILPYVAALDDASLPPAEFRWRSRHSAVIRARLQPDQVTSVQTTYHPGWRAAVNGASRAVSGDQLGLLVIRPECTGDCEIELTFDGGAELLAMRALSAAAALGAAVWLLAYRKRLSSSATSRR